MEVMGLITGRDGAAAGQEALLAAHPGPPGPSTPDWTARDTAGESGGVVLWRPSALPSRRCVLYLHGQPDTAVPEDLVVWYTERGFHFYVVDLGPPDRPGRPGRPARPGRQRGQGPGGSESFASLDAACHHLRDVEGMDMVILSAQSADALTAALWCDARRTAGLADALILFSPAFGRLRRDLDVACPVLVISPAGDPDAGAGPAGRLATRLRRRNDAATVGLGTHMTWLRLEDGLESDGHPDADAGRPRFFDELGRWLGAYMYGQVRDQLL
jgi:alpha-beta hydrolase superfamily lysophospholipase